MLKIIEIKVTSTLGINILIVELLATLLGWGNGIPFLSYELTTFLKNESEITSALSRGKWHVP